MRCDNCGAEDSHNALSHFTEERKGRIGINSMTRHFVPDFDQSIYCISCGASASRLYNRLGFVYPLISVANSYEFDPDY